eukprot:scaffold11169_cov72-Phaeocystis_antarctica.AAC.1
MCCRNSRSRTAAIALFKPLCTSSWRPKALPAALLQGVVQGVVLRPRHAASDVGADDDSAGDLLARLGCPRGGLCARIDNLVARHEIVDCDLAPRSEITETAS